MLKTLLKISNCYELEKAILDENIVKIIAKSSNLSELGLCDFDLEKTKISESLFLKREHTFNSTNTIDFDKSNEECEIKPMSMIHESRSSLDFDSPSFLRKREEKDEILQNVKVSDPPELKAFILVLKNSESLEDLSNTEKNKLITHFKETLQKEKNIKNKFYAGLSRPGARTKLRNIVDKYVRGGKDNNIISISDLKNKIISDGYLIVDPSPDVEGNWTYKESDKLKQVFGKELNNNVINDRSLYEIIRRSLNEVDVNKVNSAF